MTEDSLYSGSTGDSSRALWRSGRNIALRALAEYDLEWNRIELIGMSDSVTFRIETEDSGSFLLRIHGERFNREEILSELEWTRYLNQTAGFVVPQGLASSGGGYILETGCEERRLAWATVMHWVEGEPVEVNLPDDHIFRMGNMLAGMHEAATTFVPSAGFTRPVWGADSFKLEWSKLEEHHAVMVTEEQWKLYQAAAAKIRTDLEAMQPDASSYGLIHGDLHSGNIVFDQGQPRAIDFGRCGYGYFLYDMAAALLELSPAQRGSLIQGYSSVRELEPDYERKLECFFVMIMIGNYSHHISNPDEIPGLREEQTYALAYLREYLQGERFLFSRIEPFVIE